jgi:hypothetical protein
VTFAIRHATISRKRNVSGGRVRPRTQRVVSLRVAVRVEEAEVRVEMEEARVRGGGRVEDVVDRRESALQTSPFGAEGLPLKRRVLQRLMRQYSYFCTRKASKLSTSLLEAES